MCLYRAGEEKEHNFSPIRKYRRNIHCSAVESNGIPAIAQIMEGSVGPKYVHESADETFIVLSGVVYPDLKLRSVTLDPGESLMKGR